MLVLLVVKEGGKEGMMSRDPVCAARMNVTVLRGLHWPDPPASA